VDIRAYFAHSDSPSASSPVGNLMVKVLAKYPDLSFDAARAEAHRLLAKAAGKFHLSTPQVLSVEQRNAAKARFQSLTASRNALDTPALAVSTPTSMTQPS
jgi:electron transfer flavoprotein alpha/beta subunit